MNDDDFDAIVSRLGTHAGVREAVLDIDADWFAARPGERLRFRQMVTDEFGHEVTARLSAEVRHQHMVLVIRDTARVLVRPVLFDVIESEDR